MISLQELTEQVRAVLIQTGDNISRQEMYNRFVNECGELGLKEEDFYKTVLKDAHKSIDWPAVDAQIRHKEEIQARINKELQEKDEEIQNAPVYIERLINIAFDDGIVEGEELRKIFEKAAALQQNIITLVLVINDKLNKEQFRPYPIADIEASSLQDTLTSTNWYSRQVYEQLTAPPPVAKESWSWKKIAIPAGLLLIAGFFIFYFFWYLPGQEDKNTTRMYSYANSVVFRSTPEMGVEHNLIDNISYGTEVLVYTNKDGWAEAKVKGKKGFIASKFLLSEKDFHELNGIWADNGSKEAVGKTCCRKALLDYYQKKGISGKIDERIQQKIYDSIVHKEVWQLFAGPVKNVPNTIAFPKITSRNPKLTDFACLIKNLVTGKRRFLLFSFDDQEMATLETEQDAPDNGYIKNVVRKYSNGNPYYSVSYIY